ncbi:MAG: acetyl esterase, partial [Actinomycetota bacterium]
LLANAPTPIDLGLDAARTAAITGAEPRVDTAVNRVVSALGRQIPVRVFNVDAPDGVYFHIHGGGWNTGAYDLQDTRLWHFAQACNVAVVSVEYALAPENPFPGMADDCEVAAMWLVENAKSEFGTDRLTIGGESAGAHLSSVILLRMRDAFVGANLVYGMYDLALTDFVRSWGTRNLILNTPVIEWCVESLTPGWNEEQRRNPDLSAMYADLAGLPPVLFTCGTDDPTLHDSQGLYEKWQAANGNATLEIYEAGFHAFNLFPSKMADVSNRSQERFITSVVKGLTHASSH